jgi:uracil-DNA glycosylase
MVRIDRKAAYLTNAVRHFKVGPKGKRRLHKKPKQTRIGACKPWLDAELVSTRKDRSHVEAEQMRG